MSEQMAEERLLDTFSLDPAREHEIENLQGLRVRSDDCKSDGPVGPVSVATPEHIFFQLRIGDYFLQLTSRVFASGEIQLVGPLHELRDSLAVGFGIPAQLKRDLARGKKVEIVGRKILGRRFSDDLLFVVAPT